MPYKVAILAGGRGTRMQEETDFRPKPMVFIGSRPILWHIMKIFSHYGFQDFVVCLGYKGEVIKDYFLKYEIMNSDFTVELGPQKKIWTHGNSDECGWKVTLVDTGLHSMTGARLKKAQKYLDTEFFFLTYGDGVADIDLPALLAFHRSHGKIATVTGVLPPSRFGELTVKKNQVVKFCEKPQVHEGSLINGGFFVMDRRIFDYLDDKDDCTLEQRPLERLSADGELMVYPHRGFWHCMDTLRDVNLLNSLWESESAPWRIWDKKGLMVTADARKP